MTELIPYNQNSLITSYDDAERAAKAMAGSGFFADTRQASQAIVKILAAREIGLGPFAGMTGVNIIQGKPAFGANIMAACVKKSGRYNYRVTEMTEKACSIEFMERLGGKWIAVGISTFTIEDARKADTKNLDKFPRNMLFARAMSNGVKWFCPDVMNGSTVYTPEELGADVDEDGNIVSTQFVSEPEQDNEPELQVQTQEPEPENKPTIPTPLLEEAYGVKTSEGKLYGEMTAAGLEKMLSHMWKQLRQNHLEPEEKAEIERKIKAAQVVLAAKRTGEIN